MDNDLVSRITSALEASDFTVAEPLLAEFFASVEKQLAAMPAMQDQEIFLQNSLALMHCWLSLSRVMRSHLNEQLTMNLLNLSYVCAANLLPIVNFVG